MLLTIIIPVYNVESYIERCLKSVFESGAGNNPKVEVIVVNDGTPDHSMEVVAKFERAYHNLIIINQANAGLSAARNAGLRIARGKYIWFIDSDDYVVDNAVKELVAIAEEHEEEVIAFDTLQVYEDESKPSFIQSPFPNRRHRYLYGKVRNGYFFYRKLHTGLAQRFLFLRLFLEKKHVSFVEGLYHEDIEFMYQVFPVAKTMLPLHLTFYVYVHRSSGSIVSSFIMKRFEDILWMIRDFKKRAESSNDAHTRTILYDGIFGQCRGLLISPYRQNAEYAAFLSLHHEEIKSLAVSSYFKCLQKISLGKIHKFVKLWMFY